MTYKEYCEYAALKGFQPLREAAFEAMKRANLL
jgi:hypothetical protein